jgi:hypothetical protein
MTIRLLLLLALLMNVSSAIVVIDADVADIVTLQR